MELYINDQWTKCYGNSYMAEAIVWSEKATTRPSMLRGAPPKKRTSNSWVLCGNSTWYPKRLQETSSNQAEFPQTGSPRTFWRVVSNCVSSSDTRPSRPYALVHGPEGFYGSCGSVYTVPKLLTKSESKLE